MIVLANINLLSNLSFILLIALTRFISNPLVGFFPLEGNQLIPLTDWQIVNTAIKILDQNLFKGVTTVSFLLQHRERIMAVVSTLVTAKHPTVKSLPLTVLALWMCRYYWSVTVLRFYEFVPAVRVEVSKYIPSGGLSQHYWQRPVNAGSLPSCPCLS